MALNAYLAATRSLLQNPSAPTALYSDANLTTWINSARGQIAGDGECVRLNASLVMVAGTVSYAFSTFNTGVSAANGIQGVLNARMIMRAVVGGNIMLNPWPWEWFNQYYQASLNVPNGVPSEWTQYGQGTKGSVFFFPTPDAAYQLSIDTLCYPIDLVNDNTVEAIPYPWTDCIPYFAAYLALLSSQTSTRTGEANRMFERYDEFKNRARRFSTPAVLPYQYEQSGVRVPVVSAGVEITGGKTR